MWLAWTMVGLAIAIALLIWGLSVRRDLDDGGDAYDSFLNHN